MSGSEKEPLARFLLGCGIVLGAFLALVIGGCGFFAWRLVRDETPGRPVETILSGDETRYWCFELKPDDPGLVAAMARIDRVNQETRDRVLENTPLRGLPIPTRRADIHDLLPLKLELALHDASGWAGRATLSRGGLKLRAGLKLMRWVLTRGERKAAEVVDVDGVQVTLLHDAGRPFAIANVGHRVLAADGIERLRRILSVGEGGTPARLAGIAELHDAIRLDGEDGWAFAADTEVAGPVRPLPLLGAVASLDLAPDDALRFRVAVPGTDGAGLSSLTSDEAVAIVRSFLPPVPAEAVVLDPTAPVLEGGRLWRIEGRISGVTSRLPNLLSRWPFATPTTPSPPQTPDRRSDTPSARRRGGTPSSGD
jgi:hypothetical protein